MKNIKTVFSGFLCASFLLSSCADEGLTPATYSEPSEEQASQIALSCTASYAGNDLVWGTTSQIGLYCDELDIANQAISVAAATAGETSALFYPKTSWGDGSHTFSVYYPYSSAATAGGIVSGILTDVQTQIGTTNAHTSSLGLFYGSATASSQTDAVAIDLECATGYITYTITNSDSDLNDWSASSITLSNDSGITMSGSYELDLESLDINYTAPVDYVTVNLSNATALSSGTITAYAVVNPGSLKGVELEVAVRLQKDDEWDNYAIGKVTLDSDIEPGEMVYISLDLADCDIEMADDTSIDLSVNGTANCYIAGIAGQQYRFDATVMGNGATTAATPDHSSILSYAGSADGITPTALSPVSVKLLWQTAPSLVSDVRLLSDQVYFTLNGSSNTPLTEGNALIAAYNAAGDIIWSWHIWATGDEIEDQGYSVNPIYDGVLTAPVLMDRNIGATSAGYWATTGDNSSIGLYYQFGRKDPFMGPDDSSMTTTTFRKSYDADGVEITAMAIDSSGALSNDVIWKSFSNKTIDYADVAKYPMSLTYGTTGSWWMTELVDDLWGNTYDTSMADTELNIGTKTIYDPCPPGYRVPDPYVWTNLTDTPSGGSIATTGATISCALSTFADFTSDGGVTFYYDGGSAASYYPCTGMLYYSACTSFRVGNYAHCLWSNMSTNTDGHGRAYFFSWDYTNFYPYKTNYRTWGYPVRCMKE